MNRKEMMFQAFDLGDPPEVPATVFGGGMWTLYTSGTDFKSLMADPQKMAQVNIQTNEKTNFPIVYVGSGYNNFHAAALGGKIKFRAVGAPDLEEPLVESAEELDDLDIEDLAKNELVQTVWEATRIVAKVMGDEVVVTATAWGPFTLGAQIYGVEKLMRAIYKAPDEVRKVIDFAADIILRFYRPLLDEGVIEMTSIADPTASGDLVSRKHFEAFALPPLQKISAGFRAKGARTLLHICGDTTDKLDLLTQTGADCVSIDHKVDLAKAKEVFRENKICLAGNVDPVHVLSRGTPEEVEEACRKCLSVGAEGGAYVLMPGCDIPPTVPFENLQTFARTAREWKARA
ncbi:MAG: uroporphyrinogen decarboxylase family protein [Anaerolineae bacterium]